MGDEAVEFAAEWLEKARHDALSAEALLARTPPLTDTAAFHCQQAVEKTLKAFLTYHARVFEKVHDLGELCALCAAVDPTFEQIHNRADSLSVFAVDFRYPGGEDPTLDEVEKALTVVREVWSFVLKRLPEQLRQALHDT